MRTWPANERSTRTLGQLAPTAPGKVSNLARDSVRAWLSVFCGILVVIPFGSWLSDSTPDNAWPRLGIYLTCMCVAVTGSYIGLTRRAFGRLDHLDLHRSIVATAPVRRWWSRWAALASPRAANVGVQTAGTALLLVLWIALDPQLQRVPAYLLLAAVLVVLGWFMIVYSYAVEYARADAAERCLRFPDEGPRLFGDYVYFAQQIQSTLGGSDVQITTSRMRSVVKLHSVVAFGYNSVVVALLVSALVR